MASRARLLAYWKGLERLLKVFRPIYYLVFAAIVIAPAYECMRVGQVSLFGAVMCYVSWLYRHPVYLALLVSLNVVVSILSREAAGLMRRYAALLSGELVLYDKVNMRKFLSRYGLSASRSVEEIEGIIKYIEETYDISVNIEPEENTIRVRRAG